MRRLSPISFSEEESKEIQKQLNVQVVSTSQPKSDDPVNYPVFSIPVGKKVLVYVPNHTVLDEDGVTRLRMDKPNHHAITVGKRFFTYRCLSNIVMESQGLDGFCPICDAVSEPWDLANEIISRKCKTRGLDSTDTDNEDVKAIRSAAYSDRAVKDAVKHYTFPIVVFETANDDGKTFVKDDDGNVKFQIYWYDCPESTWEKWEKCMETMEDEPTHPGGHFYLLNYIYKPKGNKPQIARDAARNLTISERRISNSEKMKQYLDELTEGWTPEQSRSHIFANMIYSKEDLTAVCDEALEDTRKLLMLYKDADDGAAAPQAGFQLSPVNKGEDSADDAATAGAVSQQDALETDLDME